MQRGMQAETQITEVCSQALDRNTDAERYAGRNTDVQRYAGRHWTETLMQRGMQAETQMYRGMQVCRQDQVPHRKT